ncbi:MAG: Hsp70 family protein [Deltaproteobacteria bacterium]|nr:Hsp70 family protein [Deltaproteobacteria bacterium]
MTFASRYVIGIDLGTTNVALAYVDTLDTISDSKALPIVQLEAPGKIKEGFTLPSFCYFGTEAESRAGDLNMHLEEAEAPADLAVGAIALNQCALVPDRVVQSAKSWLCHAELDRQAAVLPWGSDQVEPSRKISPIEASACYLKHLKRVWDATLGRFEAEFAFNRQEVIITVPASFDEAAQRLTLKAAALAGFPDSVRLLEEPQAAFYYWLERYTGKQALLNCLPALAQRPQLILICDVGGGTTDFSLFEVSVASSQPLQIKRVAVGDHLLLGGDNIDLALSHYLEERLVGSGEKLSRRQWQHLVFQARLLKERILQERPGAVPAQVEYSLSVPSEGSKLMAGALSVSISGAELQQLVLDGFFPECGAESEPRRSASGLREWGLPYAADSAVTRHLASFLRGHRIDAVLCTGGSLKPVFLQQRLCQVISSWQGGEKPLLLELDEMDIAVAKGAARYGWLRRKLNGLISGGYPRSVYLELHQDRAGEAPQLVCLLPKGVEEGSTFCLENRSFELLLNRPVSFQLYHSRQRAQDKPGDLVAYNSRDFHALPPLQTMLSLPSGQAKPKSTLLKISLEAVLTELGVLELYCVGGDSQNIQRWRLEFCLRALPPEEEASPLQPNLDPDKLQVGLDLIDQLYGKPKRDLNPKLKPKGLLRALEKSFGRNKEEWNLALLRALWPALERGITKRGRSLAHETVWLNLAGYVLRPGYGAELDSFRVNELWRCFHLGLAFPGESSALVQWWIMWRRVSGGLKREQQQVLLEDLFPQLGKQSADLAEGFRLAASLERVSPQARSRLGDMIVKRLTKSAAPGNDHLCWALGRLASRVPLYAGTDCVIEPAQVESWFSEIAKLDWNRPLYRNLNAAFAQACRLTGDRARDISAACRDQVAKKIKASRGTKKQLEVLTHTLTFSSADQSRLFGDALPAGLRLAE